MRLAAKGHGQFVQADTPPAIAMGGPSAGPVEGEGRRSPPSAAQGDRMEDVNSNRRRRWSCRVRRSAGQPWSDRTL